MKNKFLTFVIGLLVGAIITTLGFWVYSISLNKKQDENQNEMIKQLKNNEQMQKPNWNMDEPPAKPEGNFQGEMHNNDV